MAYRYDKALTPVENMFALLHATHPATAEFVTAANAEFTAVAFDEVQSQMKGTLVPVGSDLLNQATLYWVGTDLASIVDTSFEYDEIPEGIPANVVALISALPCSADEVNVERSTVEGVEVVTVSAVAGAVSVHGTHQISLTVKAFDLDTLDGEALDGFDQAAV